MNISSIYLNCEQQDVVNSILRLHGKEIENKRVNTIVHKYNGTVYVPYKIEIHFIDGNPIGVFYNGINLGYCFHKRTSEYNIEYKIGKVDEFNDYRKKNINFILKLWYVHDGGIGGYTAHVYDKHTDKDIDFSNYNTWY